MASEKLLTLCHLLDDAADNQTFNSAQPHAPTRTLANATFNTDTYAV